MAQVIRGTMRGRHSAVFKSIGGSLPSDELHIVPIDMQLHDSVDLFLVIILQHCNPEGLKMIRVFLFQQEMREM